MSSTNQTCEALGDQPTYSPQNAAPPDRLPLMKLLALALATFVTVLTDGVAGRHPAVDEQ